MPAVKKERLDGEEMALGAFAQPEYLAPLNAAAIPVVTPHPPPYDHLFAHPRAYLGLRDTPLHRQHLHHQHADDLMLERFSSIPDFQPFFDNGEPCIEVECGENKALLYINKLCQGSKGPSIKHRGEWLTPNEFQFVSGRETAKDWKRSIRHKGKSLKTLMSKGILQVHPPICDCPGCRISSPVFMLTVGESEGLCLERDPGSDPEKLISTECKEREGCKRLTELLSMATGDYWVCGTQSRGTVDKLEVSEAAELAEAGRKLHSPPARKYLFESAPPILTPPSTPSWVKKGCHAGGRDMAGWSEGTSSTPLSSHGVTKAQKSKNSHTPALELGSHMTPEEHYRRMMSALNEHGSYEEQQQRLYQLASSHGDGPAIGSLTLTGAGQVPVNPCSCLPELSHTSLELYSHWPAFLFFLSVPHPSFFPFPPALTRFRLSPCRVAFHLFEEEALK
ncbi:sterile alpha motif domain-containing protein 11 isoform X2 [Tachysurus ichikawai]